MSDRPALDDYEQAQSELADALVHVWRACEGGPSGLNLPECLSYALALAARTLGLVTAEDGNSLASDATESAGYGLVRHRPGSWEAQHVTALIYPVELLADEPAK